MKRIRNSKKDKMQIDFYRNLAEKIRGVCNKFCYGKASCFIFSAKEMPIIPIRSLKNKSYKFLISGLKLLTFSAGQLIVEAVIAIFFITTAVLLFVGLLARSSSVNTIVVDQYAAAYLASEGIEVVKNIVDGNYKKGLAWNDGINSGDYAVQYNSARLDNTYNYNNLIKIDNNSHFFQYDNGNPTSYRRRITVVNISADHMDVVSTVNWTSHGINQKVALEDHFYNWRQR